MLDESLGPSRKAPTLGKHGQWLHVDRLLSYLPAPPRRTVKERKFVTSPESQVKARARIRQRHPVTVLNTLLLISIGLAGNSQVFAVPHTRSASQRQAQSELLFRRLASELRLGQLQSARQTIESLENLTSSDPAHFERLGQILSEYRQYKQAERAYSRAAFLLEAECARSNHQRVRLSKAFVQIGRMRFARRDYAGTLQILGRVDTQSLEPKLKAALEDWQGVALLAIGKLPDAVLKYDQAVRTDPEEVRYLIHRAWAALLAGDLRTAESMAGRARSRSAHSIEVQRVGALIDREKDPARAQIPFSRVCHLRGEGLVCCPCNTPCPCRSNGPPTSGHCENVGAFQVAQGHYGNVELDGITFAVASGAMGPESVPSVVYVNREASQNQSVALERLFQTFLPNHPLIFLRFKPADIFFGYTSQTESYEVTIPGLVRMAVRRQLTEKGEPRFRTAGLDFFSNTLEYAQNVIYQMSDSDAGMMWDYSGRQANIRKFDVDAHDYWNGNMLVQYADFTGDFNETQLDLIARLGLPLLRACPSRDR